MQELAMAQALRANHRTLERLEVAKEHTERLIDELPDALLVIRADGSVLKGNTAAAALFGTDLERLVEQNFAALFPDESWSIMRSKLQLLSQFESSQNVDLELPVVFSDGKRDFHWNARIYDKGSAADRDLFVVQGRDISRLREYEHQMMELFSCIPLGILTVGTDGRIQQPHSSYLEFLLGAPDLVGADFIERVYAPAVDAMSPGERQALGHMRRWSGKTMPWWQDHAQDFPVDLRYDPGAIGNESTRWLRLTLHPIMDGDKIGQLLVVVQNQTDWVMARLEQSRLSELSRSDGLTGLKNRRALDETLASLSAKTSGAAPPFSVVMIDVDHFKAYNDNYGHQAGDACLQSIAGALRNADGEEGIVARYGGEEFAVVLPGHGLDAAREHARRLQARIAALAVPHAFSSAADIVTVSMGLAVYDPGAQDEDAATLLRRADRALYAAKEGGRNRIEHAQEGADNE